MEFILDNNTLTISITGKIDSVNADEVSSSINEIITSNNFDMLVIDFDNLDYISSAGLRVMLKLKKENKNFKIINVKSEVYEIFEMTGFNEIMDIEKGYKHYNVDGLEVIGKGAKGTVYRYNNDTVIKVYNDKNSLESIKNERRLAKEAFVLGIPTAISYDVCKVDDLYGSVFELLASKTLSKKIDEDNSADESAAIFTNLLKTIHGNVVSEDKFPDVKNRIMKMVENSKEIFGDNLANTLLNLIKECKDTNNLLHMDFHTNNVLMQKDEALLIDMDTLSRGNPIFELGVIDAAYDKFPRVCDGYVPFLDLNTTKVKEFYNKFFNLYFKDYSEDKKKEIKEKIDLISWIRVVNHYTKRNEHKEFVEEAISNIKELLTKIDTLNY